MSLFPIANLWIIELMTIANDHSMRMLRHDVGRGRELYTLIWSGLKRMHNAGINRLIFWHIVAIQLSKIEQPTGLHAYRGITDAIMHSTPFPRGWS